MNISFDLDGVLTDSFHWGVYTDKVIHQGLSVTYEEFWISAGKCSGVEQSNWIHTDIYYSHKNIKPEDFELLQRISKKHTLYYITSRPLPVELTTLNWMIRNRIPQKDNLIFSIEKDLVINSLGIELHVEDMQRHVERTRKACKTLLLDQVWNWGYEADNVTRIFNLREVVNHVPVI